MNCSTPGSPVHHQLPDPTQTHVHWVRKGVRQGCILSPCLFNVYAEYIIRNAERDEAQAGIKIAGRNINNLRYADNTALMAEETSLVAQTVKRLPTMPETRVQSLGWEDLLEKEMATHSSILAWKIPWTEEPVRLQSMSSWRVGHNWATSLWQKAKKN